MALTSPSFIVNFNLDVESATFGKFVITDTTSYSSDGIANSDVIGFWRIDYPDGTYYIGNFTSPDIIGASSFIYNTLPIPKDSNGAFMQGTYNFSYYIRVAGAVQPGDYQNANNAFNFCPINPPVSNIAPLEGGFPCIDFSADCFCRKITAHDTTDYGVPTTMSRVFSLFPPPSLGLPTYTTNSVTLVYNFMYSGGYEVRVNTLLTYVTGIFTITNRVEGSIYENVKCDINISKLINCFNTYRSETLTMAAQYGGFFNLPNQDLDKWLRINGTLLAFNENLRFGNWTIANAAYDELKLLLACSCSCDDDSPQLVNPYCSGSGSNNSITVVAAGAGITVSTVVVGQTTTYTVAVQQATLDQIATNTTDIATLQALVASIIAGTTGQNYRLLLDSTTETATGANTTQTDLITGSVPAILTTNGDYVQLKATLTLENDSNLKTIRVYFGSFAANFSISNNAFTTLEMWVTVTRTGVATQNIEWSVKASGGSAFEYATQQTTSTENLANPVTIKLTGQNSVATAAQITSKLFRAEYHHLA